MKRAVFFDVDGTLISYSTNPGHIPKPTLEAIRLLMAAGHVVALATGRSLITAGKLMGELGIGDAVLCSGAHVLHQGRTLSIQEIEAEPAAAIARKAIRNDCEVFACNEEFMYVSDINESKITYIRQQNGCDHLLRPICEMTRPCIMNIYGSNLPDRECFTGVIAVFEKGYIEVRPAGVSKATGIRRLSEHIGIPMRDVVAIGDGNNDVEMLEAAGLGIAVGNGSDRAKAAADLVAGPIDEGGILNVLKQIGLI